MPSFYAFKNSIKFKTTFLTKTAIAAILFLIASLFCGCSKRIASQEQRRPFAFYELCFYFPKLPEKSTKKDVETASAFYEEYLAAQNIAVYKRRNSLTNACYFIDKFQDIEIPDEDIPNNVAKYLLTAYFNRENSSLYGVRHLNKSAQKLYDSIPFYQKLPIYFEIDDGLVVTGLDKKILYLSVYLKSLDIKHQFGFNQKGELIVNIVSDSSERWKLALFLYESLQIEDIVSPEPGDFAILSHAKNEKALFKIKNRKWQLSQTPISKNFNFSDEDAMLFSAGVLSLPFDEETLLKYFYSLANSFKLPMNNGRYYSPNFKGLSVSPTALLLSSELTISGEAAMTPENIFMWITSVEQPLKSYPDAFYANLLSLKIAKRLYTEPASFLGGDDLINRTSQVPFEKISENLFHLGNVSVYGALPDSLYLYSEDLISEYPVFIDISKTKKIKALYGNPKESARSLISFVARSSKADAIAQKIKTELLDAGFVPFQFLYEEISEKDCWSAVSVLVENGDEDKILELYDKKFSLLNPTLSIGVYRVAKEEQ